MIPFGWSVPRLSLGHAESARLACMLTLAEVLSHFPPAKKNRHNYTTKCPVPGHQHGDANPSLDIAQGRSGIVFTCRSRKHETADILALARPPLRWEDVQPNNNGHRAKAPS